MFIETRKRAINYWLKILKLTDEKYVRKCYNMLCHFDSLGYSNWATNITRKSIICSLHVIQGVAKS